MRRLHWGDLLLTKGCLCLSNIQTQNQVECHEQLTEWHGCTLCTLGTLSTLTLTFEDVTDEGVAVLAGHRAEVLDLLLGCRLQLLQMLVLQGIELLLCECAWGEQVEYV